MLILRFSEEWRFVNLEFDGEVMITRPRIFLNTKIYFIFTKESKNKKDITMMFKQKKSQFNFFKENLNLIINTPHLPF